MSSSLNLEAQDVGTVRVTFGDQEIELPLIEGSEGERGIDISELRRKTGLVTVDEGFVNTGSTRSAITFLNGEKGILRYRGYPIEDLAKHCDFVEVAYLLINGDLPSPAEAATFRSGIRHHTMIHEDMRSFYNGFPRDAHPMAILSSVVGALSTFYQDSMQVDDPDQVEISIYRLLAKLPTIAAYSYKKSMGQPFMYPNNDLDYCENFLHMMFATPAHDHLVDPDFAEALNMLLIVHADHEQNCSTSTVRMVGSSNANLFASISAGIGALWGPLHGGANEACVNMLEMIAKDGGNVKKYVDMAKDKNSSFRLMGFGHRVYKNFDPRAQIIRACCDKLLAKLNIDDPLFVVAQELQDVALEDEYFVERKLYPNVDFRNTILIMTTNAGAEAIKNEASFGFQKSDDDASYESMKTRVMEQVERVFRPEFLNRLDDTIIFRHLTAQDLKLVIDYELSKVRERLLDRGLALELQDEAKEFLIRRGTDLDYGARPLRRAIEQRIEDPLSEELLRGAFEGKDTIVVKGILHNSDGDTVAIEDMTMTDDFKMIDPDGKKVKVVRLEFHGETRGLADEDEQPVSATVGESGESESKSKS